MDNAEFNILIVDDEKKICDILKDILDSEEYTIHTANDGAGALKKIETLQYDMIILDIKLPDCNGLTFLKKLKEIMPTIPVIMISAFGTIATAVEALKIGATDFIEKPLDITRVSRSVDNIMEKVKLERQTRLLQAEMLKGYTIIGESPAIKRVLELIDRIAPTDSNVLILGESGVGKELVARNLHMKSNRIARPFVKVNCAALPSELIESELFGYEKGAFTGAYLQKKGQIEVANSGTLFLDEIGDMNISAQVKILKAIEDKEILRLGSTNPLKVNVRLITATNQDLEKLIHEKQFRQDLYHRINVMKIIVSPLRERISDISVLTDHFLKNACIDNNRPIITISKNAISTLEGYHWPGNVRELKNLMEKAVILIDNKVIEANDIKNFLDVKSDSIFNNNKVKTKDDFEREYILSILKSTDWHLGKAAKMIGIDRSTLFRKMKKLNIINRAKL
jgi:two-component system nitrogen regulation response regulator NtrX